MRTGIGYDIHRLVEGRPLVLGGVRIEFELGLLGHSDADVLAHAVIDALLGAAGLGDIGEHFPDTDPTYKDADSGELLRRTVGMVRAAGFAVRHVDSIIVAERPKLKAYKEAMTKRLAQLMAIPANQVNVKAKTAEGLGPIGQVQAIAAWAAATLVPVTDDAC